MLPELGAVFTGLGGLLAGVAAWRSARRTHTEIQTNHGMRAGEYLELLPQIHELLVDHVTDRQRHLN